jgi:hypothetical protein
MWRRLIAGVLVGEHVFFNGLTKCFEQCGRVRRILTGACTVRWPLTDTSTRTPVA